MRQILSALPAFLALAALGVVGPSEAAAQAGSLDVAEAVLTTAVQDRQPVDTLTSVSSDVGQVYLWTVVTGAQGETAIAHVWYHRDQEMARVPLRVMGPRWRTWTSKRIVPAWTGSWRVEVVGPGDAVLETVTFQVGGD